MTLSIKAFYRESLYSNSFYLICNSLSISFFGFLFWIIAAGRLSIYDMGIAISLISLATLVTCVTRFGIDAGFVRYFKKYEYKDKLYNTIILVPLLISLTLAILSIFVIQYVIPSLNITGNGLYVISYIMLVILISLNTSYNTVLMALRRSDLLFAQNLLQGIRIIALFTVPFVGIYGVVLSFLLSYIASNLFASFILYKNYKLLFKPVLDRQSINKIVGYSFGNYFSDMTLLIPTNLMPLIVLNTLGAQNSAYFSIACSLSYIIWMIPQAISNSMFVEGSHDMPLHSIIVKSLRLIYALLIPVLIVIFLLGDKILLLYGADYATNCFELLKLFSIASVFSSIVILYSSIKKIEKDMKTLNFISITNTLLILLLSYPFLMLYGIDGLGYCWIISNAVLSIFIVYKTLVNRYDNKSRYNPS